MKWNSATELNMSLTNKDLRSQIQANSQVLEMEHNLRMTFSSAITIAGATW